MDRDKKDPYVRCRFSEIVRFVFYVAVVIFLLSSVVLVAVDYVQIKQRLAAIEDKDKRGRVVAESLCNRSKTDRNRWKG